MRYRKSWLELRGEGKKENYTQSPPIFIICDHQNEINNFCLKKNEAFLFPLNVFFFFVQVIINQRG